MKQNATNEFKGGLNLDLHPIVTPNTVLTDNLNGTFITYNGNEFCLQNDRGNKEVAKLTNGYTPIGIKEHNGILYIVSVNGDKTEIGTYPGIDWNIKKEVEDEFKAYYTPLGNLYATMNAPNPSIKLVLITWNGEKFNEAWQILKNHGVPEDLAEEAIKNTINNIPNDTIYLTVDDPDECRSELLELNIFENVLKLTIPGGQQTITKQMDFNTSIFNFDINHPVTLDVQDSYDGSVNLIFVDGKHQNRIINTGFSKLTDKTYKLVYRNSLRPTNSYTFENLDQETALIRTSNVLTNIDLLGVQSGGQFKGGNYTFYIKFGDADYNQTDVVAESGIVSIFNGNDGVPSTISGTLADERTDKMINLEVTGLNHAYSKIYIYYSREYSDTQGYRMTEYGMFNEPIDMETSGDTQSIWLTGFEQMVPINSEELNVDYHTIDWARAETQHSNILFLGNVGQEETFELYNKLEKFTKENVITTIVQNDELSVVTNNFNGKEYYSTSNIYHKLGYWPDEIYRFGIVYILKDGSTTPAFNMCGGKIEYSNSNFTSIEYKGGDIELYNEFGVFLTPDVDVIGSTNDVQWIKPISFQFKLNAVPDDRVLGWFVVRQKRIPRTICQGLSIGIDDKSHLPLIYTTRYGEATDGNDPELLDTVWKIQSFLSYNRTNIDYDALYKTLESLDNTSKKWWKWLLVLASPSFGPIFGLSSGMIGLSRKVSSNFTINQLKKIVEDNKPLLEYKENIIGLDKKPNDYYAIPTTNNWTNTTIDDWNSNKLTDESYTYVDETDITDISTGEIYEKEFQIYKCVENEEPESENKYRLEKVKAEYNSGIQDLVVQCAKKSNDSDEPTLIKFTLNTETITSVVADSTTSLENLIESIVEYNSTVIDNRFIYEKDSSLHGWGLLSLDPCVNSTISGMLDGSQFDLIPKYKAKDSGNDIITNYHTYVSSEASKLDNKKCVFVPSNTNVKLVDSYAFSNVAGDSTTVSQYKQITEDYNLRELRGMTIHTTIESDDNWADMYHLNNINLIRGMFCPYIGIADKSSNLSKSTIYSVRLSEDTNLSNLFKVRYQDSSEYYAISNREYINTKNTNIINVYRGDCYTNTIGIRILRNFIDTVAPYTENIIDSEAWDKYVILSDDDLKEAQGKGKTIKEIIWDNINLSDVNTVDLGYWVTFKCLSSYNLGLRSIDSFHVDEQALLGSPRSFYPLNGASTATGNKMEESFLLNDGLSATVGRKRYNLIPDVPYSKSEFANRIMFSNVNVTDAFTNGYRTFQGLAYKDYDKQYGAITKLISLGQNIFVVMEHGLGLVPVNPKALMQTTTGEAIHIYGYGVLPDEMTIISQDYGSKYEHSVIRTPIGIYGIDVDAKKIWRFSDKQGFETISDMKIETYLKDNLKSQEIEMGNSDIRTHYNGKKGDLMFTWYNKEKIYSICYNERQNLWVTRYDWTPIVSENINDEFYSLNKAFIAGTEEADPTYSSDYRIWDHHYQVGKENNYISTWYDNNRGFEFEFVVSDPIGINKIFENLQIISNNVSPEELQITVIGDDYTFKRDEIAPDYERKEYPDNITWTTSNIHENNKEYRELEDTVYKWDWRLHQMAIVNTQRLRDIYKYGRRLGNMQYKNGMWFIQIDPLRFNINVPQQKKEIRIRDKWAKIRIRYSGKDLAIITAIRTLINV